MSDFHDMRAHRRIAELESKFDDQLKRGGGGPYDPGMEARVAKLESALEYVQRDIGQLRTDVGDIRKEIGGIRTTDFRITFGAIIAVALGLAGLMAKGFHWL